MYSFDEVLNYDPELAKAMDDELARPVSYTHLDVYKRQYQRFQSCVMFTQHYFTVRLRKKE